MCISIAELQRKIRHDTRIDVVPGAAMRDHMILFQDYYNANELFDYLTENSVFLGGEVGNPDSWFVPPSFFKRYWFLCPNHKPERMDNAVEIMIDLGKSMAQVLSKRKEMYIQRDKYKSAFPEPTKKMEDLTKDMLAMNNIDTMDLLSNDLHFGKFLYCCSWDSCSNFLQ